MQQTRDRQRAAPAKKKISRKRRFVYLAIPYLVFLLILGIIELGTRLFFAPVSSLELFVTSPQQRAQVANAQQSTIFEGDPWLLWRLRPNLRNAIWDFTVVSTNAEGFRAAYPVQGKKPGVFRIVCLGDSVTFGYRVPPVWPERPTDYNPDWLPYPMLLEKQLRSANSNREVEGIAMAVPGYTSHQGLTWLRREIDNLKPDLLIVSYGWNDASRSDVTDREAVSPNWYGPRIRWIIDHSQAFAHVTKWLRSSGPEPQQVATQPRPRVSAQEYVENMMGIVSLAQSRGIKAIVLAAPYRDNVTNPSEAQLMISYRAALKEATAKNNIHFLEIPELTEAAYPSNEGWFGELIHPNHMGHRLIASELLEIFSSQSLIPGMKITELIP